MAYVHELLSEQFFQWEIRGRGWQVFKEPVPPEPPFRHFNGHYLPEAPVVDDGRQQTLLSSLVRKLSQLLSTNPPSEPEIPEPGKEPDPEVLIRDSLVELQTFLPANLNIRREEFEQFLSSISLCSEPVTFELLGSGSQVSVQFVVSSRDEYLVKEQLQAFFPEAFFLSRNGSLQETWNRLEDGEAAMVEFGLSREFMFTLGSGRLDPFVGIIGVLSSLKPEEIGLFQVIFQSARQPWSESIIRSVTDSEDKPFFVNRPELVKEAKEKTSRPLYAAVVRIATKSPDFDRTWEIARNLASSLGVFDRPGGNELIPLVNDEYPYEAHEEDILKRQSRRSGMLLNSAELAGFVHLPSTDVRSAKLTRQTLRTKPPPKIVVNPHGSILGENVHSGVRTLVTLSPEHRVRHIHIIGGSGTGKSTLLFNLIRQDIENGEGLAVLDPHGDLVDRILGIIPPDRISDVVLVDPSDEQFSVGFNILSAHSDLEKNLLASDLVSVFQRLSTSWGDQMGSVLNNAILAFLESNRRGTLADLRRFLLEPAFRAEFLKSVSDQDLIYYWQKGFPQLSGTKSIGPVLTRLETFLAPKCIRYMVSNPENRLDFGKIMDTGKIFLAKLSQGLLGKENSYLLGTLIVSKFQQLTMARQSQQVAGRRNFWLYIDEFHNFITPSMAEILAGARKYRLGLVLAHQELRQLQRDSEVASAVMSNSYTRIVFRVGDDDARKLADGFTSFESRDLQNLEIGNAIARVERSDFDFNLSIPFPDEPDPAEAQIRRQEVTTASREKYSVPRTQIESAMRQAWEADETRVRPAPKPKELIETPPPQVKPPQPEVATPPPEPSIAVLETPPVPSEDKSATPTPQPIKPPAVIAPSPESQTPPSESKVSTVSERKAQPRPIGLGRGGPEHRAIQKRIKEISEALGFRSTIEKQILDGHGSVDVLLERNDQVIACEISLSRRSIDEEVGNVSKCLKAGFPKVAVICTEEERLKKIAAAVVSGLGSEMADRVIYVQPDQFIDQLQALELPIPKAPPVPEMRRGYKIKRSILKLTPEEQKQREEAAIRSIAEAMRKKG